MANKVTQEQNLLKSLKALESELQAAVNEKAEMQRELSAEKGRNQSLRETIGFLNSQLDTLNQSNDVYKDIINSMTDDNQILRDKLKKEQLVGHQTSERFKTELRKITENNRENQTMVEKMQNSIDKRNEMIELIEQRLQEMGIFYADRIGQKAQPEEAEDAEGDDDAEAPEEEQEEAEAEDEEGEPKEKPVVDPIEETEGDEPEDSKDLPFLQLDLNKYRTLYETMRGESEIMGIVIDALNKRVNELCIDLIESQQNYLQKEWDFRELMEQYTRLETAFTAKQKRLQPFKSGRPPLTVPPCSKVVELNMKIDMLMEENNFLRAFMSNAVNSKDDDFQMFRMLAENVGLQFETNVEAMKAELKLGDEDEEEDEDEED